MLETSKGGIEYEYCVTSIGSEFIYSDTPGTSKYTYNVRTLAAGDKPFSVGPAIWKDFALLGSAPYFAFVGSGDCCNSGE
ncbi:MAG: hypothetical protein ABEJ24_03370 [Candidatus Magasanikbacteria bacterium]